MKTVIIGQAAFGERALEAILNLGEDVVGVFCPPDPPGKPNALRDAAQRRNVAVYQPKHLRDPEVYETVQRLRPDLNVMAFVTDIVPERVLNLPRYGSIQYHPSLLPKHRGGSAINWAIINGETTTGLTIFWPNRGVDTGPILLQREVEIVPDDTTGSLYFNQLLPLGVDALVEAIELIKSGAAPKKAQDEALATYEPLCTEERAIIDWTQPIERVYNLVRGCNPQPGATTTFRGRRLKIFDCQRQSLPRPGSPGEIIAISQDGLSVAAGDNAILIKRVQPIGLAKIKTAEFVSVSGLSVGDRFGA